MTEGGFDDLLGQEIQVYTINYYVYTGVLIGVHATSIQLENPTMARADETSFNARTAGKPMSLPAPTWYVQMSAIESFGLVP